MDWLNPTYLVALLAVPVAIALFLWASWKRRLAIRRLGDNVLIAKLASTVSARRRRWKSAITVLALTLIGISLAGPRLGTKLREFKREGVDLVIALDVSESMLAEDVLPNRLTRAKYEIGKLLDELEGDRVGLVLFAGDAFIQCPLTSDYSAVRLFLDIAHPSQIPTPGTDFGAALDRTVQVFTGGGRKADMDEETATRALLIVSDGENHAEIGGAASAAEEAQLVIFSTGVGETDGVPVPVYNRGRRVGFKKDREGNTVITRLEEAKLRELARDGGYFRITRTSSSLQDLVRALRQLDRRTLDAEMFEEYDEKYQWPLFLGIILLLGEMMISDRRVKRRDEARASYTIRGGQEEDEEEDFGPVKEEAEAS
jgi:Ca-activated chloride channel family protein